ncbi:hypothetical protein QYE76_036070 [Lolium multiflorum]|uniref:Uncharacterized protein n=1 Tax=Lolium multiflorum TaxID=4521 RepID=A0AAD8R1B7_LOLMU|nr:hypothetical protein QYE76_036070 [Lolium multiflorum]
MIRPCFLPVGMSTSNRIIKPGYESYQLVVAARQLGLGQVSPHFFLHHLTESRADLPDILTGQRCYYFFDALAIPIPNNLSFTSSTDGFETWWSMWKTHAFRRRTLLKQLDAEYNIPAEQQQDGPEPTHADGSPFEFFPLAPMVLFCKNSPPLKKVVMQSQPISPNSASKSKASPEDNSSEETPSNRGDSSSDNSGKITPQSQPDLPPSAPRKRPAPEPVAPQAPIRAGQGVSTKRTRKEPQAPSSNQEASNPDDTSSGGVEEVRMPSANLDPVIPEGAVDKVANLAKPPAETQEPITSSSAVPLVSGEGCDLSGLLTFDPESIEPAPSPACDEPRPSAVLRQFQRLKALLSSPIETLVEDSEEVKSVLEEVKHHLPVTLQLVTGEDEDDEAEIAEVDRVRADALRAFEAFLQ